MILYTTRVIADYKDIRGMNGFDKYLQLSKIYKILNPKHRVFQFDINP